MASCSGVRLVRFLKSLRYQAGVLGEDRIDHLCDRRDRRGQGDHRQQRRRTRGQATDRDVVGIQRHRAVLRQSRAAGDVGAGVQRDARQRQDVSDKRGGGAERGRAADLPEHIGALTAADHVDSGAAGRDEGAADLEDEDRVGIALRVQCEGSGQLRGVIEGVNARREHQAAQVLTGQVCGGRPARQHIVSGRKIHLSLARESIGCMERSRRDQDARGKPDDRIAGADADVAVDHARTGVGDRGACQHPEACRGPQIRRLRMAWGRHCHESRN